MTDDTCIGNAKIAEIINRYDDMVTYMKAFVKKKISACEIMTGEERQLLANAFNNWIEGRKAASDRIGVRELVQYGTNHEIVSGYGQKIAEEIEQQCGELLTLISDYIQYVGENNEGLVFSYKMKGDFLRFLVQINSVYKCESSVEAYEKATEIAGDCLPSTHPLRLELALNFSVLYYEVSKEHAKACFVAKTAFDNAVIGLDELQEKDSRESIAIMQQLRDNITAWSSDVQYS